MSKKLIVNPDHATFEGLRQQDAHGNEYWLARSLAKEACRNSGPTVRDHSEHILEMVKLGSGAIKGEHP